MIETFPLFYSFSKDLSKNKLIFHLRSNERCSRSVKLPPEATCRILFLRSPCSARFLSRFVPAIRGSLGEKGGRNRSEGGEGKKGRERGGDERKGERITRSETKVKNKEENVLYTIYTIYIYIGGGGKTRNVGDLAAIGREFHSSANQEGGAGHDQLFVHRGVMRKKRSKKVHYNPFPGRIEILFLSPTSEFHAPNSLILSSSSCQTRRLSNASVSNFVSFSKVGKWKISGRRGRNRLPPERIRYLQAQLNTMTRGQ